MPVYQGTYYARTFVFQDANGAAINITGWTFRCQIRKTAKDATVLLELTTANGGFVVADAANGKATLSITEEQSETLPEGKVAFDVLRTDIVPGPTFLFSGRVPVKVPVTRDVE